MLSDLSGYIWETRYRRQVGRGTPEASVAASWQRVAEALVRAEPSDRSGWAERFGHVLRGFHFLPGGRIMAGAGTGQAVTLFNCFALGTLSDTIPGMFRALRDAALTMRQGGGIGIDFSPLLPRSHPDREGRRLVSSSPVAAMQLWDTMCATLLETGSRRGAMMATLRDDHPDILEFIDAKRQPGALRHFNLSVLVSDPFMDAVRQDATWALRPPGEAGHITRHLPAREIWRALLRASYDHGDPGVLFIDRINRLNNLSYYERIAGTNPCGEVPLPANGACDLGSINLAALVLDPFGPVARLDGDRLEQVVPVAVRMLDNVIDISRYPLPAQRQVVRRTRRIGLGITGLADALSMLDLRYGDPAACAWTEATMRRICHAAYRASVALAEEKGAFPAFDRDQYLGAPFVTALPQDIRDGISRHGIRNSHLLAIAPTGTISLLAGNISSGIEPAFAADYDRTVMDPDGSTVGFALTNHAVARWRHLHGGAGLPPAFVAAAEVPIAAQLDMQAAVQRHVDNAVSKTVQVAAECDYTTFAQIFDHAYAKGLKGCTAFRLRAGRQGVLSSTASCRQPACDGPDLDRVTCDLPM